MKLVLDFSGAVGGSFELVVEAVFVVVAVVVGSWDLGFSCSVAVAVAVAVWALLRAAMADSVSLCVKCFLLCVFKKVSVGIFCNLLIKLCVLEQARIIILRRRKNFSFRFHCRVIWPNHSLPCHPILHISNEFALDWLLLSQCWFSSFFCFFIIFVPFTKVCKSLAQSNPSQ